MKFVLRQDFWLYKISGFSFLLFYVKFDRGNKDFITYLPSSFKDSLVGQVNMHKCTIHKHIGTKSCSDVILQKVVSHCTARNLSYLFPHLFHTFDCSSIISICLPCIGVWSMYSDSRQPGRAQSRPIAKARRAIRQDHSTSRPNNAYSTSR